MSKQQLPRDGAAGEPATQALSADLSAMLACLQSMRDGGFSVRLPGSWTGLAGEVADAFNEIAAANQHMATEFKRVGQALRERAELMDLASDAIMVRDLSGSVTYWNAAAERLYGWKRKEILGRHMHHTLKTRFPAPFAEIQDTVARTGRWEGHLVQRAKNGAEITVACRKALKIEENGSGTILEVNRDITCELRVQEVLQKTEKLAAMGRVAGMIAHEINNPLEAIMNALFLLRRHPSLDAEAREFVRMADEELRRLVHITRQSLGFYREPQEAAPVVIAEVLEDVLLFHRQALTESGVTPEMKMRSRDAILGFPGELKQVFLNLVTNAIQAMPKGGRLRVHVRECMEHRGPRRGIRISICDTGNGIKPEVGEEIFEPFFTTKSTKGAGLGLWISRGIVHKYEGAIRFRTLCRGCRNITCFSVFFPDSQTSKDVLPFKGPASPGQMLLWESVA